jgi:5-methylcytosine-specific restriction endonuclease McrA
MSNKLIRKSTHSIEEVLSKVNYLEKKSKQGKENMFGDMMHMNSLRYHTFIKSGIKCVCCGIKGNFFAKERDKGSKLEIYHFNLYAINNFGKEVLMTKDHVIPKYYGGQDSVDNLQTMCEHCNKLKGNRIISNEQLFLEKQNQALDKQEKLCYT